VQKAGSKHVGDGDEVEPGHLTRAMCQHFRAFVRGASERMETGCRDSRQRKIIMRSKSKT